MPLPLSKPPPQTILGIIFGLDEIYTFPLQNSAAIMLTLYANDYPAKALLFFVSLYRLCK